MHAPGPSPRIGCAPGLHIAPNLGHPVRHAPVVELSTGPVDSVGGRALSGKFLCDLVHSIGYRVRVFLQRPLPVRQVLLRVLVRQFPPNLALPVHEGLCRSHKGIQHLLGPDAGQQGDAAFEALSEGFLLFAERLECAGHGCGIDIIEGRLERFHRATEFRALYLVQQAPDLVQLLEGLRLHRVALFQIAERLVQPADHVFEFLSPGGLLLHRRLEFAPFLPGHLLPPGKFARGAVKPFDHALAHLVQCRHLVYGVLLRLLRPMVDVRQRGQAQDVVPGFPESGPGEFVVVPGPQTVDDFVSGEQVQVGEVPDKVLGELPDIRAVEYHGGGCEGIVLPDAVAQREPGDTEVVGCLHPHGQSHRPGDLNIPGR